MKTILLVDDEPVILEIYSEVLSGSYKTILAENGQEALDILKTTSVDLIISDIEMPILSGIELLQQRDKKIPIIMISGNRSMLQEVKELATKTISKPFQPATLLPIVNEILA